MKLENAMKYRDYLGIVEYSDRTKLFCGEVFGVEEAPSFSGRSVEELEAAFHQAVEEYLATCEKQGKSPKKSYRGVFNVRVQPQVHQDMALCALEDGNSLNAEVELALEEFLQRRQNGEEA